MTGVDRSAPPADNAGEDPGDPRRERRPPDGPSANGRAPDMAPQDILPLDWARDWMTLWQSELSALAVDREAREAWHLVAARGADAASAMLQVLARAAPDDHAANGVGAAGTAAPARAPPAAAPPDPRDAEIERLLGRVAELEQRLARRERRRR